MYKPCKRKRAKTTVADRTSRRSFATTTIHFTCLIKMTVSHRPWRQGETSVVVVGHPHRHVCVYVWKLLIYSDALHINHNE